MAPLRAASVGVSLTSPQIYTPRICCLLTSFNALTLSSKSRSRPSTQSPSHRAFSTTPNTQNWLTPKRGESSKSRKGRPRIPTGGSTRGTTLVWGDYGIRLKSHDRRISAQQLKIADETIRRRLRGEKYRLYHRVSANIGVYTSGNDQRMGKGKGSFDYWAARVAVSRVLFELKGEVHEAVVRDAMRLAGNKLPGVYEFVRRGDPAVMGVMKVGGEVGGVHALGGGEESAMPNYSRGDAPVPNLEATSRRIGATTGP